MTDHYQMPPGFKIISGGQTGADRAALDWALAHNVPCGGWCPAGRKSEDGRIPEFYMLKETRSKGYLTRTEWNVRDSDATFIFTTSATLDGGSKRTADFAERLGKPWLHIWPGVAMNEVIAFLRRHRVLTLNVAGKRASAAPGVGELTLSVLDAVLLDQGC